MSNNSRLVILFIALIGIAGLSFFIFSEDNVDQQSNIQSEAEIQTTTTISNNSTTSTSTTTTLMETTTTTSTTSTSTQQLQLLFHQIRQQYLLHKKK